MIRNVNNSGKITKLIYFYFQYYYIIVHKIHTEVGNNEIYMQKGLICQNLD